jgi:hypothetical protein
MQTLALPCLTNIAAKGTLQEILNCIKRIIFPREKVHNFKHRLAPERPFIYAPAFAA